MSCFKPLKGFPLPGGSVVFYRPPGHSGRTVDLPCKRCIGCRLDFSAEWATRIMHETKFHESNWFLTLTQDGEHYPRDGSVSPRPMQLFWKRVRKAGLSGRNVYNGEYGGQTGRAHFHAVAFGLELRDLVPFTKNERGEQLWTSATLSRLWGRGHCTVGAVTPESAMYVAGYCLRDTKAKHAGSYDLVDLSSGELIPRALPFFRQSRRPGIGRGFYERYRADIFPHDFVVIDGRKRMTPRYYLKRYLEDFPLAAAELKAKREESMFSDRAKFERRPERLAVREAVKLAALGAGRRGSNGGAV